MNAIQLRDSIHTINSREKNIEEFEKRTRSMASDWLREAALQGQDLLKLKTSIAGDWQPLFDDGRLSLVLAKAQVYMRIASRWKRGELQDDQNQQMLALFNYDEDHEHKQDERTPKQWPGYMEAISRASRFLGYVERIPIKQWPKEGIDRLKEQMLPVAAQLWPERFV